MPNILAFLSQLEKIYWNMQSKVPGQFEAKWFVSPKSKVLARNDRDSKQLKGQLTILQSHNTEKNLTWYLTASILLDEKSLDKMD